jgi:hypothetical protein
MTLNPLFLLEHDWISHFTASALKLLIVLTFSSMLMILFVVSDNKFVVVSNSVIDSDKKLKFA